MSMTRRNFIVLSSVAMGTVPFRRVLSAQTPAAPAVTRFEAIRRNVGYFTGRGGTIGWLVNKDAVIVVDTQYADTARACVDGLKERSSGRVIDVVFNTHHHGDHTGGNGIFKAAAKQMVAQARVPELQKQFTAATASPAVVANATFDKVWSEKMGDERVNAAHYGPGHTGGDAIIRFEEANVVHMGDLLFHELHPRVDRPGGASVQNWMKTLTAIAREFPGDTVYIAGHAKPGLAVTVDRAALLRQASYFDAALSHVRKGMSANQSKEEIAGLAVLPGFESHASSGTILTLAGVLTAAYDELAAK